MDLARTTKAQLLAVVAERDAELAVLRGMVAERQVRLVELADWVVVGQPRDWRWR